MKCERNLSELCQLVFSLYSVCRAGIVSLLLQVSRRFLCGFHSFRVRLTYVRRQVISSMLCGFPFHRSRGVNLGTRPSLFNLSVMRATRTSIYRMKNIEWEGLLWYSGIIYFSASVLLWHRGQLEIFCGKLLQQCTATLECGKDRQWIIQFCEPMTLLTKHRNSEILTDHYTETDQLVIPEGPRFESR
jgi:hypothetical protein